MSMHSSMYKGEGSNNAFYFEGVGEGVRKTKISFDVLENEKETTLNTRLW